MIPGSGRSPGEGSGNPLQCPGLENSMDRKAWWGFHGVAELDTNDGLILHFEEKVAYVLRNVSYFFKLHRYSLL